MKNLTLNNRQQRLAEENLPITLSISLHAPTDEARRRIMPVANKYGISRLMESCRNYVNHTGRRIVFEYALIEGVNTALEDADQAEAEALAERAGVKIKEEKISPPVIFIMYMLQFSICYGVVWGIWKLYGKFRIGKRKEHYRI